MKQIAFALFLLLIAPAPVAAQSQRAVDKAKAAADEAAAVRDTAVQAQAAIIVRLEGALARYSEAATALADVTLDLSDRRQLGYEMETDVRSRRRQARDLLLDLYLNEQDQVALLFTGNHAATILERDLVKATMTRAESAMAEYRTASVRLDDHHNGIDDLFTEAVALNERSRTSLKEVGILAAEADANALRAGEAADRAVAVYEAAVAALEAAENEVGPRVARWRTLVEKYFPERLIWKALRVMQCESNGRPDAVNASSGASGLFQFLASTWSWASAEAGFAGAHRFDAEANVASAAWLVAYSVNHPRGEWAHWECQP